MYVFQQFFVCLLIQFTFLLRFKLLNLVVDDADTLVFLVQIQQKNERKQALRYFENHVLKLDFFLENHVLVLMQPFCDISIKLKSKIFKCFITHLLDLIKLLTPPLFCLHNCFICIDFFKFVVYVFLSAFGLSKLVKNESFAWVREIAFFGLFAVFVHDISYEIKVDWSIRSDFLDFILLILIGQNHLKHS